MVCPCRILTHFIKCPKTCLFFKLVKYTMIISSDPPFKDGHARFPMITCINKQIVKWLYSEWFIFSQKWLFFAKNGFIYCLQWLQHKSPRLVIFWFVIFCLFYFCSSYVSYSVGKFCMYKVRTRNSKIGRRLLDPSYDFK